MTLRVLAAAVTLLLLPTMLLAQESDAERRLRVQGKQFEEEIIQVAEGVFTSVGTTVSNVSMIVGDDGVIIIDTGMTTDAAEKILVEFRKITDKPVKAIIFTHGHGDHTGGAVAFVGDAKPQIWARANFGSEERPLTAAGLTIQRQRGVRQAGFALPASQRINNGVAPAQRPERGGRAFESGKQVVPTHTFDEPRKAIEVAGVKLELVAAPGETEDELYVWYPAKKVLFAGDNFYRSFPNLYAIRGTPYRDVKAWADSLDKMVNEGPSVLVGGHTRPVLDEKEVHEFLVSYRDAVRFVHDKTVEGMNKGLTPDQLVEYVKLPDHLADKPYLGEFYGNVEWSVRSVFNGYLGWFDGNPTNLFRLSQKEEAGRMAELAGGADNLLKRAKQAFESGDPQWACQLADHLIALDHEAIAAKGLKADALTKLGENCVTATGRNYYLTVAQELRNSLQPVPNPGNQKAK